MDPSHWFVGTKFFEIIWSNQIEDLKNILHPEAIFIYEFKDNKPAVKLQGSTKIIDRYNSKWKSHNTKKNVKIVSVSLQNIAENKLNYLITHREVIQGIDYVITASHVITTGYYGDSIRIAGIQIKQLSKDKRVVGPIYG